MVQCKTCLKQDVGSASTKFRFRFNNYKCCSRKYNSGKAVAQDCFFSHFNEGIHGMKDWEFMLIDQADNLCSLRRRESYWQYKLNTFAPYGLNECGVPLDFG